MEKQVELRSLEKFVNDNVVVFTNEKERMFDNSLSDKNAKAKLLKGARRIPFELVKNSVSWNLVFNLGSWHSIVLPAIKYWNQRQETGTCKIGTMTINIASVKSGTDASGKHIDTQIVFLVGREQAVCHFYNTTQLILVNGHAYKKLIEEFLVPFFESRIASNLEEIMKFNEMAMQTLGAKTVKRRSVKYKGGSTFDCGKCEFASKTITALAKHSRNEHGPNQSSSSASHDVLPLHSTRNNSLVAGKQLNENISISNLSEDSTFIDQEKLKFTCMECEYRTTNKISMEKHVVSIHNQAVKEPNYVCGICNHKFLKEEDYTTHLLIHDVPTTISSFVCETCSHEFKEEDDLRNHILCDHALSVPSTAEEIVSDEFHKSTEEEKEPLKEENFDLKIQFDVDQVQKFKCDSCAFEFVNLVDLNSHNEATHRTTEAKINQQLSSKTINYVTCSECEHVGTESEMQKHMHNKHADSQSSSKPTEPFPCESCNLVLANFSLLQEHVKNYHEEKRLKCEHCKFECNTKEVLEEHIIESHPEIVILHTMAKQVDYITDNTEANQTSLS